MLKKFLFLFFVLASSAASATLQIQSWTLASGARVLFVENHSIPIVDLSVAFDAGSRRDAKGKAGTASLTNGALALGLQAVHLPGTSSAIEPALTEAEISDAFADTGAQSANAVENDHAGLTLRTLSSVTERDAAIKLMARILAQPGFPVEFVARDKARTISAIKEDLTKPEAIAEKAFAHLAYGEHPYGYEETVASVSAITRADMVAFHRAHYVANRAIIAMIGDITRADAEKIADQLTMRLPQGAPLPLLPEVPAPQPKEARIPHPASQSHILIGAPAVVRGNPDHFALTVGNYVLGSGGFVSRLTDEVREKRGLAYSIDSYFIPRAQKGPFQIGLQTKKEQTDEALKVVRDTLAAYLRDGPTEEELKAAKDNLVGGFPLLIDNNRKILGNIANIGFYNLPLDYLDTWTANVEKVSRADIVNAFNRVIAADKLVTVVVGAAQP
jgi:zinc protease